MINVVNQLQVDNVNMLRVLDDRMNNARVVIDYWNKGQVLSVINALNMQNNISVTSDIFGATFA